jgi:hypothetical protein
MVRFAIVLQENGSKTHFVRFLSQRIGTAIIGETK